MTLLKAPSAAFEMDINDETESALFRLKGEHGWRELVLHTPELRARVLHNRLILAYRQDGIFMFTEDLEMECDRGSMSYIDPYLKPLLSILKRMAERMRDEYDEKYYSIRILDMVNEARDRLFLGPSEREETDMNDDKIYNLIAEADKCRKEVVLCLLGKPGIGKTEAVERFARDHDRNVVHIIASQILPSEVSGMTMPNQETRSMDVFDHYRLSHMKDGDILFFDELLKGQQQVLNACLTLIQERRLMSGTKLPDVLIIAAANPLSTPMQLPLEIRQRFLFVNVTWNAGSWCDYMEGLGFDDRGSIDALAFMIDNKMEEDTNWNTLTPRTATKLCMWLRDSDCSLAVRDYIRSEFGADVLKFIIDAACGRQVDSAEKQVADEVLSILSPIYQDRDADSATDVYKAMEKAREISREDSTDVSELMSILEKLPEWEEIAEALSEIEIEKDEIKF